MPPSEAVEETTSRGTVYLYQNAIWSLPRCDSEWRVSFRSSSGGIIHEVKVRLNRGKGASYSIPVETKSIVITTLKPHLKATLDTYNDYDFVSVRKFEWIESSKSLKGDIFVKGHGVNSKAHTSWKTANGWEQVAEYKY